MANTLAYYDTTTITAVKSFIVQAPGLLLKIIMSGNPQARESLPKGKEQYQTVTQGTQFSEIDFSEKNS